MNHLRAVLWDMDGTLLDSEPLWQTGRDRLAARFGIEWTDQDHERAVGRSLPDSAERMREKGLPLSIAEINRELVESVMVALEGSVPWQPGAIELLAAIRVSGARNALVTQAYRPLAELVTRLAGDACADADTFSVVVGGDDVRVGKPDPEAYLVGLERLRVPAANAVAIEDSPSGIASALAAALPVLAVPYLSDLADFRDRVTISPTLATVSVLDLQQLLSPPPH